MRTLGSCTHLFWGQYFIWCWIFCIITSKLLWPTQNTVIFSQKILYNPEENVFQLRIINTNSMPIINPEIRMAMTQHGEGDMIAGVLELDHSEAEPIYLGYI